MRKDFFKSVSYLCVCFSLFLGLVAITADKAYAQDEQKKIAYVRECETKAHTGDSQAMVNLANCYYNGYGTPKDYDKSFYWYQQAADKGDADGQCYVGVMYHEGYGVKKNDKIAVKWFEKAVVQKHAYAQYALGYMYHNGYGLKKDEKKAIELYKSSFANGIKTAIEPLWDLTRGREKEVQQMPKDFREMLRHDEINAAKGNISSMSIIASYYYRGIIYDGKKYCQDLDRAIYWFEQIARREDGRNAYSAIFDLVNIYSRDADSSGLYRRDKAKAFYWTEYGAVKGIEQMQGALGVLYLNGNGVTQNTEQGLYWLKQAALQGSEQRQSDLGLIYYNGSYNVKKDYEEAMRWFSMAAQQGNKGANEYIEIIKDRVAFSTELQAKAQAGDVESMKSLAMRYDVGWANESKDLGKAFYWYEQAAKSGDAYAQFRVGEMYEEGRGVERSYAKAMEWYLKSSDSGWGEPCYRIALMYKEGRGVEEDGVEADAWYSEAATRGHKKAQQYVEDKNFEGFLLLGEFARAGALVKL